MSTEQKLRELFASYPAGQYQIDTLEICHSLFTQSFYFTREPGGITANIVNCSGVEGEVDFTGVNFEPVLNRKKSDLDSDFSFTLADPDNQLDDELDLIPLDNDEKIQVVYRVFLSDDFTAPAETYSLEVLRVNQKKGIFTIDCGLPQLNWQRTGIVYDYDTFPPLRAL